MPYVPGKWLKLHVDMSALCHTGSEKEARRHPVDMSAPCHTSAEKEARRLRDAIGEVTTLGSSEANLRQLINECRNFLHSHPRSMYADLRVAYRMLSYLCEVRTSLRTQNVAVDSLKDEIAQLTADKEELENLKYLKDEIIQLEAEKSELQSRLEASETARDQDRQFANDLELRLKEYVTRSEHSYQTLVRYNSIVQEYAGLNEEIKDLRLKALGFARSAVGLGDADSHSLSAGSDADEYAPSLSQSPDSYASSMPDLTDRSSPAFTGPLPITPDVRTEPKRGEEVYSRRRLNRCGAEDHPASCQCDGSPSPPTHSKQINMPKPSFIIEHVGTVRRRETIAVERQSGLSRSAPKNQRLTPAPGRTRMRSLSDVSPVPTRPPSRQGRLDGDSRPGSRSSSPERSASSNSLGREGSIRIDSSASENVRRLYNILQQPRSQLSASPPELSSPSPCRSRSGSMAPPQVATGNVQPSPATGNHTQPIHPQPPSNVISRASDAAMAIEKSQKEKALREREKEKREHRKSDKDGEKPDEDRARPEPDRAARKQLSSASSATNYSLHAQPASAYHSSGLSVSPRESHLPSPPINASPQKTPGAGSASNTLGRKSSTKNSSTNYLRPGSDSSKTAPSLNTSATSILA